VTAEVKGVRSVLRFPELHERFVDLARGLMTSRGWTAVEDMSVTVDSPFLGGFTRPLRREFVGRVLFMVQSSHSGVMLGDRWIEQPELSVSVRIGLELAPADRLIRFLGPRAATTCLTDSDTVLPRRGHGPPGLSQLTAVESEVRALVAAIDGPGQRFLAERDLTDEFIEYLRSAGEARQLLFAVPAVLGASGRREEALRLLEEQEARDSPLVQGAEYREYARRLRAWLRSGAIVPRETDLTPAPPGTSPPPDASLHQPVELGEVFENQRKVREALAAVKGSSDGRTREFLRDLLVRELAARSLERDPLWLEQVLDGIQHPEHVTENLDAMLEMSMSVLSGPLEGDPAWPPDPPTWLLPPPRAFLYDMPQGKRHVVVDLDDGARSWLERAFDTRTPGGADSMPVDAWLAWDPEPRRASSLLAVHIGKHRVGTVPPELTAVYEPVMTDAESVKQLPRMLGDLGRLASGTFLLQIPLPH
jgi:hypothetical protein